ncbi:MAG: protein-disulfide reductase DsbD domain-containing protein [Planctomycetota bacterium]
MLRKAPLTLAFWLSCGALVSAQSNDEKALALSAKWQPARVAQGYEVTLEVTVQMTPGWHIYGPARNDSVIPSVVGLDGAPGLEPLNEWTWPAPKRKPAAAGVEAYDYYSGKIALSRKFLITKAPTGVPTVRLDYQACTDSYCINPTTETIPLPLVVSGLPPNQSHPLEVRRRVEPDEPVEVVARGVADLAAGQVFELEVQLILEPGWYVYGFEDKVGLPTKLVVDRPGPFVVEGAPRQPTPKIVDDPAMGGTLHKHVGNPVFFVALRVPDSIAPGRHRIGLQLDYMACKEVCRPPVEKLPLEVDVWVGPVMPASTDTSPTNAAVAPGAPTPGSSGALPATDLSAARTHFEQPEGRYVIDVSPVSGVEAGAEFELEVTARMPAAWHIYGLQNRSFAAATRIELTAPDFTLAPGKEPTEPTPKRHSLNGEEHLIHERSVTFKVPVKAAGSLGNGIHWLRGNVNGQVCHDEIGCVILDHDFVVPIGVGRETRVPTLAPPGPSTPSTGVGNPSALAFAGRLDRNSARPGERLTFTFEGRVDDGLRIPAITGNEAQAASQGGLLGIIWASMIAALVALLTPCVYPMIPITISVFTKQAESRHSNVVGLALIFCAGIVVTFTGIGFTLSAFLGSTGANQLATHWAVNLGIGLLFLWFAGSLFGYYNIQLPAWLTQRATSTSGSGGVASVLFMGFVFSITTFTCVGPIVSTLLALAVTGGTWYAAAGMLAFSSTFAVPFFFLALFPKFVSGLPRSGGWLNSVKVVLGFVEVAAAWKFFCVFPLYWGTNPIFRELVLAIWGIVFVLTVVYLAGWIRFPHDSPVTKFGLVRSGTMVFFLALAGYCFWGATGRLLDPNLEAQLSPSHPSIEERRRSESADGVRWRELSSNHPENYADVLAQLRARAERKPILINFTGHT